MPGLEDILGQLTGQGSAQGRPELNSIADTVIKMLGDSKSGGVSSLVKSFASKGLGDQVASWVGLTENKPVSGDQVSDVLGADKIQAIAKTAGIDLSKAKELLALVLPKIIDKLTPEGKVPEGADLEKGLAGLAKLLGGTA
jgi:uncharacterized protein YidB (DUF937 family)